MIPPSGKTIGLWVAALTAAMIIVLVVFQSGAFDRSTPVQVATALPAVPATAVGSQITTAEQQLSDAPTVDQLATTARLYLQLVRETADSNYFERVEQLLSQADAKEPGDPEVSAIRAQMALSYHDFSAAAAYAQAAINQAPQQSEYYGLLADSQIELGQYSAAAASLQTMVDLQPNYAAFTRIAYLRELHGDRAGAITAWEEALRGGASYTEHLAWAMVQLATVYVPVDRTKAKNYAHQARQYNTDYPAALILLAQIAALDNDLPQAMQLATEAFTLQPTADHAILIARIAKLQDDTATADQYLAVADAAFQTARRNGTNVDLEYAQFLLDSDRDTTTGMELAAKAVTDRPSIAGFDVYAQALYTAGDYAAAKQAIAQALQLGQHSGRIVYHAAQIAAAQDRQADASTLYSLARDLDPVFWLFYSTNLAL